MKKQVMIILFLLCLVISIPKQVNATRGCCSSHGGVDCSRVQANGNVVCNDGSTSSTCSYSSMKKCKGYNPKASSSTKKKKSTTNNNSTKKKVNTIDNAKSKNSNSNNKSSSTNEVTTPKSNIATLSKIMINGENIDIDENMQYKTQKENIDISYETTDSKATVKVEKPSILKEGNNTIKLIVTAEDQKTKKFYTIQVMKEKSLLEKMDEILNKNEKMNPFGYFISLKFASGFTDLLDALKNMTN